MNGSSSRTGQRRLLKLGGGGGKEWPAKSTTSRGGIFNKRKQQYCAIEEALHSHLLVDHIHLPAMYSKFCMLKQWH